MKIITVPNGQLNANAYFVINESNNKAVIIDCGMDIGALDQVINSNNLQVEGVLLTHWHFDHAYVASELQSRGKKIYVSKNDYEQLKDNTLLSYYFGFDPKPCKADITFSDGDIIDIANMQFKVLETPGHSSGSCCFLIENALFSGDTLFFESIGRSDFKDGNNKKIIVSLNNLLSLTTNYTVYPGHGPKTSIFYERNNNPFYND